MKHHFLFTTHSHSHTNQDYDKNYYTKFVLKNYKNYYTKVVSTLFSKNVPKAKYFSSIQIIIKSTTHWSIAANAFYHFLITDLTLLFILTWWEKSPWMRHAKWWLLYGNQVYLELWRNFNSECYGYILDIEGHRLLLFTKRIGVALTGTKSYAPFLLLFIYGRKKSRRDTKVTFLLERYHNNILTSRDGAI